MEFVIETIDLTKKYGELTAVDKLGIQVKEGEIFGMLGPNGAGKTTFINMLSTTLKPTSGTALVNGYDILKQAGIVRKYIGVVFQQTTLDNRLTGGENLEMHAYMHNIPKTIRNLRIDDVLDLVELKDWKNKLVNVYSGGMKRRLEIARGLLHYPKVLFLDEPTLGLDPQSREHIWKYIKHMAEKEKTTVILTTHYMEEADALCDRIAIIDYGKIIALDTPENLKSKVGGTSVVLQVFDTEKAKSLFPDSIVLKDKLIVPVKDLGRDIGKIFRIAVKNQLQIYETNIHKPSLNDVFLLLTGRDVREDKNEKGDNHE